MRLGMLCVALVLLAGCGEAQDGPPKLPPEISQGQPQDLPRVALQVGTVKVQAQVADDDDERAKGLMFVRAMPEDEGMLFVWPEKAERSFWMRNTYIPLDLLFIDGRRIVRIVQGVPLDESALPSGQPVDKVLEMNAGWAARRGVKVGDLVF